MSMKYHVEPISMEIRENSMRRNYRTGSFLVKSFGRVMS